MANPLPLINGRAYSHASVEIRIAELLITEVKSIKYKDNCDPSELRGTKPQALARTIGEYKAEGSIELFRAAHDQLVAKLGKGFMAKSFDVVVSYAEEGMPLVVDTVRGCRIKSNDKSSEGNDPTAVSHDLHPMYILHNGVEPIPGLLKG